ncbi:hypothetical protein SH449x_005352 [Pirellulaceae bacterium SH449]
MMLMTTMSALACWNECFAQILGAPPRFMSASPNFTVYANDPNWAKEVSQAAEEYRKALAIHWTGQALPQWSKPCVLFVQDSPRALASGETNYTLVSGAVINFKMTVRGTRERILDSVLPHEVTHTIIASHFAPYGRPVPRWADEGMCTTVEHEAERRKHDQLLIKFLSEGEGLPFATLFLLEDYPANPLPLYAQGYSLASFLIAQGGEEGPRTFIRFLEAGMKNNDWVSATNEIYGYPLVGKLQVAWNDWVNNGGRDVSRFTAIARGHGDHALVARLSTGNTINSLASAQPVVKALATGEGPLEGVRTASAETTRSNSESGLTRGQGSYYLNELRSRESTGSYGEQSLAVAGIHSPTGQASRIAESAGNNNPVRADQSVLPAEMPALPSDTPVAPSLPPEGIQHSVSQPRPFETMGGVLRRKVPQPTR